MTRETIMTRKRTRRSKSYTPLPERTVVKPSTASTIKEKKELTEEQMENIKRQHRIAIEEGRRRAN